MYSRRGMVKLKQLDRIIGSSSFLSNCIGGSFLRRVYLFHEHHEEGVYISTSRTEPVHLPMEVSHMRGTLQEPEYSPTMQCWLMLSPKGVRINPFGGNISLCIVDRSGCTIPNVTSLPVKYGAAAVPRQDIQAFHPS